jgi:hypothetical protein
MDLLSDLADGGAEVGVQGTREGGQEEARGGDAEEREHTVPEEGILSRCDVQFLMLG